MEEQFDYASLVETLNRRYKRENSLQARNLFHAAKKTRPESDFEFSYRLRKLTREAYPKLPTEYIEDLLVQRFVRGASRAKLTQGAALKHNGTSLS